jgi:hypothetical protein
MIQMSGDNANRLQHMANYDFETNIFPGIVSLKQISMEEWNIMEAETTAICSNFATIAFSTKYQALKKGVYKEFASWLLALPDDVKPRMNPAVIQPDGIITFITCYYIRTHGKKTQKGSTVAGESSGASSSSALTTLENYYISASLLRTVIGAISSTLSTMFGRTEIWSIANPAGNPCRAPTVISFKKGCVKLLSKIKTEVVPATPITKSMLLEIIDALDKYIDDKLQNVTMKLDILKLLLLHRDIVYYIYLFISSQRGGEGCKLMTANVCFNRNPDDDTIEFANVTIPAADVKNDKKNNIRINRHDVFQKGDKYCFIHRYPMFKALCIKHGYMETDMKVIFPSCTKTKTLNYVVHMKYASCISKFKDNLKLVGLLDKYSYLTLHSFRRGSIQNYKKNGESQKDTQKRANFSPSMYNKYTNKQIKTKKDVMTMKNKGTGIEDNDEDDEDDEDYDDEDEDEDEEDGLDDMDDST